MNLTARSPICAYSRPLGSSASATNAVANATTRTMRVAHDRIFSLIVISPSISNSFAVLRDDAFRIQRIDLVACVADAGQQLARMLAHRRRIDSDARPPSFERDRKERRLDAGARLVAIGDSD